MMEVSSQLPLAICVVPAALAVVAYPLGRAARPIGPVLNLLGAAVVTALAVPMALGAMKGEVYVSLARELRVDSLSALMVLVIGGVSLAAAIYAFPYMRLQELVERVRGEAGEEVIDRRLAAFYALSLAFLATMLWACTTNNIIMLYVSVEASTLASGLLVAFYWDRRSLEASYKYLMLLTVGIAFALFGCVLLYASAVQHIPGQAGLRAMLISDLNEIGGEIPRTMALMVMAFFIVGFGTKAGIAPFHPWLPDAHAEAPSPVSALLSGVMIKMAIYALARTLGIFFPLAQYHPVAMFVIVLSAFTMLLGGGDVPCPGRPEAPAGIFVGGPDGIHRDGAGAGGDRLRADRGIPRKLWLLVPPGQPRPLQIPALPRGGHRHLRHRGKKAHYGIERPGAADAGDGGLLLRWRLCDLGNAALQRLLEQTDPLLRGRRRGTVVGVRDCDCGQSSHPGGVHSRWLPGVLERG